MNRLDALSTHPRLPVGNLLALLLLCLAVYLPGVLRLPAVDRTEVVFAETTRDMVLRGSNDAKALLDPRYGETVHQFRPIGTYWAQALFAGLARTQWFDSNGGNVLRHSPPGSQFQNVTILELKDSAFARTIAVYRLPGMIAVTLAVLALYWLAAPLVGGTAALIAAGLFAVAPLTVLDAHLAIAEGLTLFPATVAMLCLLRIYAAPREERTRALGLLFWVALGFGMMINALLVPILVVTTLIALRFFDRDLWWLQRLGIASGLPIALLIASPWIIVRVMQDGVPFSGLGFKELLAALGGSQDMKLRAMPGTFVLAALLGFLPGTALLAPALAKLWGNRDAKIARFLLAWVIGYIVYLELLSSKPGTYMVQPMFPAFALAVGVLAAAWTEKAPPKFHAIPWPPLAALFALVLFAAPYAAVREWPAAWLALPMGAVAGIFAWSAAEGRAGSLHSWAASGIAALGLFAVTLIAGVMPSIDKIWPAREVQRALASCTPAKLDVVGYNEPSSKFILKGYGAWPRLDSDLFARGIEPGILVVNSNRLDELKGIADQAKAPLACVDAINTMRGCALSLTIVANSAVAGCKPPAQYACPADFTLQSKPRPLNSTLKPCD